MKEKIFFSTTQIYTLSVIVKQNYNTWLLNYIKKKTCTSNRLEN